MTVEPAASEATVCLTRAGMARGGRDMLFALVSVFLFAFAFGVAASHAGLDGWAATFLSAAVFAGASQFASLELLVSPVPLIPLLLVVFAVNARHILMGAALYPWFGRLPFAQRLLPAALMTDINWVQAMHAYDRGERDMGYLVGSGLLLWVVWIAGTAVGAALVQTVPFDLDRLGLDLTFLLFFVCMLTGLRRARSDDIAWLAAGASALLAVQILPAHWHVMTGAIVGGIVGLTTQEWLSRRRRRP